jgi:hypothetical protein
LHPARVAIVIITGAGFQIGRIEGDDHIPDEVSRQSVDEAQLTSISVTV